MYPIYKRRFIPCLPKLPPPRELRRRAWQALKATWPTLLTLNLVINLISYLAGQLSDSPLLSLIASLLLSIPTMGILKGQLEHLRGTPLPSDCFASMFPNWTKVLCYELWSMLFIFLWMLPGMLVSLIGGLMGGAAIVDGPNADVSIAGLVVLLIGIVLMLALLLRAVLNYSVSGCLLVDNPEMGGLVALAKSKALMHGNRWRFVKLNLPIFLLNIGLTALIDLMGDGWFTSLLSSLVSTAIAVLMAYYQPVFYRDLFGEG